MSKLIHQAVPTSCDYLQIQGEKRNCDIYTSKLCAFRVHGIYKIQSNNALQSVSWQKYRSV